MLFILSIVCLIIGIAWIVTVLLRSARDIGNGIDAPKNETGIERRGKLWWTLVIPLSVASGVVVLAFVGIAVYFMLHPGAAPK
jgi:hypothetical protein